MMMIMAVNKLTPRQLLLLNLLETLCHKEHMQFLLELSAHLDVLQNCDMFEKIWQDGCISVLLFNVHLMQCGYTLNVVEWH